MEIKYFPENSLSSFQHDTDKSAHIFDPVSDSQENQGEMWMSQALWRVIKVSRWCGWERNNFTLISGFGHDQELKI